MQIIDFHAHPYLNELQRYVKYPDIAPGDPLSMKQQILEAGINHICGSARKSTL